jgi:hypothetical protein
MSGDETFSIRIVNENGDPISDAKVQCLYAMNAGAETVYTNEDGWGEFPILGALLGGSAEVISIIVNDEEVQGERWYPEDGDTLSFTI